MQDGTYPPRNFATLGPSGLRPPFTEAYKKSLDDFFLLLSTGQVSDFIHHYYIWQNLMFLLNSRHSLFKIANKLFFSRSYEINLPSSFNIIVPYALIYSIKLLALELVQFLVKFFQTLVKSLKILFEFKNFKKVLNNRLIWIKKSFYL